MESPFEELEKDIMNIDLPEDINAIEKIKGTLKTGKRFYWYYQEDKE
jgi:tRNA A58 N-methylase Trm61